MKSFSIIHAFFSSTDFRLYVSGILRFCEKPFTITPNPRFLFLSKNHREVFAHLLYGIRQRSGFIELIGEVGTGKTTVLRTLMSQLAEQEYRLALIFNPGLSALDLLRSINREFGLSSAGGIGDLLHLLNDFLLQENAAGNTVILVIDEAQNLEPAVLEQIRLLSNLETETTKLPVNASLYSASAHAAPPRFLPAEDGSADGGASDRGGRVRSFRPAGLGSVAQANPGPCSYGGDLAGCRCGKPG